MTDPKVTARPGNGYSRNRDTGIVERAMLSGIDRKLKTYFKARRAARRAANAKNRLINTGK